MANQNILVAYYSRTGQNYVNGKIQNLKTGNTEIIANYILQAVGGDRFRIDTVADYPVDYMKTTEVAKDELRKQARPVLKNPIQDISGYDTIFLGFPNWWNTMPMAVYTFLEGHDFSGKKIIPFCTHEGSGMGGSVQDISKICPGAKVERGITLYGHDAEQSESKVKQWLSEQKWG